MFNQFCRLEEEVVKRLPFLKDAYFYVYKDSAGSILRGILYSVSDDNFEKASKRLTGEQGEIVKRDKVFVLPNCRIPMFKLKDYIKSVGAVITGDVSEATKIIGHERATEETSGQPKNSSMLVKIYPNLISKLKVPGSNWANGQYAIGYYCRDEEEYLGHKEDFRKVIKDAEDVFETPLESITETIVSPSVWNGYAFNSSNRVNLMTPTCAFILYNHILKKIPIVNEDFVYEKLGKPVIIDQEMYESIEDMLSSADESNNRVGTEALSNCDITPSLYYIWKLAQKHRYKVSQFSSFKNVRLFIRMSKWEDLGGTNAEQAIELLYEKGVLTKDMFRNLASEASKRYVGTLKSTVFKMIMEPSEKFGEFSAPDIKFEFSGETGDVEIVE